MIDAFTPRSKLLATWRRVLHLAWPVMTEQALRTLMRTTDVIVSGFFSPAAVAAVGLADIYGRLPLRFGQGFGDGAIALSSQDTGSDASHNRNEAVTQALLIGFLAGLPFAVFGLILSDHAIVILGAESTVVSLGAAYLAVILVSSPARHMAIISARAIQGTGDTQTPMVVNGGANLFNIVGTVTLAFGIGPAPELSIVGIAAATALADTLAAGVFLSIIASNRGELAFVLPSKWVITKQLIVISSPRIAEGLVELAVEFPFNAILLVFGTEVNAAYHIGQRMYKQVAAPLARGYGVAANVIIGQSLGRGSPKNAYLDGWRAASLAVITIGSLGIFLFVAAEQFVLIFTRDVTTIVYATHFAQAYAVGAGAIALFYVIAGALRGGSETRAPFYARLTGMIVFLLGTTYFFGIWLGYGVVAAYAGIILDYVWRNIFVCAIYMRRKWITRGTAMMKDRGSIEGD